jgi:hypothetical protein
MNKLTLPIIGLTGLIGYFLNKDGKNPRRQEEKRENIEKFDKPNGDNIYSSNKVNEVNQELLEKSLKMYKDAEEPEKTGVLPPLYNIYNPSGNKNILQGQDFVEINSQKMANIENINKTVDVTQTSKPPIINERPMFQTKYKGTEDINVNYSEIDNKIIENVSLLTGKPIDNYHTNMVPFFGSNIKQNVETFQNEMLLDKYTGNKYTFQHKKEIEPMFDKMEENIYGTPIFTNEINSDRYISSLYKQGEKPFQDEKIVRPISGTFTNKIKPEFKSIDELRASNKPQISYKGRTIDGQKGEVRGIQAEVKKQRPPTYYEKGIDHLFRTTGEVIANKSEEDYNTNFKNTSRQAYNIEYVGGAKSDLTSDRQRMKMIDNSDEIGYSAVQEPKRENYENDYIRNVSGYKSVDDYGRKTYKNYETERVTTEDKTHLLNRSSNTLGLKPKYRDLPKTTIKETTIYTDNTGNVKTTFDKAFTDMYNNGLVDVSAKTTNKQTTLTKNFLGNVNKNDGMGYLVNKYDAPMTGKEIIVSNIEYRPGGPQTFQLTSGKNVQGEIKSTENQLLKEQEDRRQKMNPKLSQVIATPISIGVPVRSRFDDDPEDTVFDDRNNDISQLISKQHADNPYSIYSKNNN